MYVCMYVCVCMYAVKQVFSSMEFLGWYTTGGTPTQKDLHFHRQVCVYVCVCVCV